MSILHSTKARRSAALLAAVMATSIVLAGCTSTDTPTADETSDSTAILTPQDMIGKKIGVQASNTSLFEALLAANGIDPSEVTIVPVEYDPSVLINGDVDGFVAYLTNEAITVAAEGYEVANLPFADNGLPFVAETVTTTDSLIESDRDKLKAFLVAEILGWTDEVNDPAAGSALALETYGADLGLDADSSLAGSTAQAEQLVVSDETAANGLFTISKALQDQTVASLASAGIDVAAADLFDLTLLDEVYEEYPELIDYAAGAAVPESLTPGDFGDLALQLSWIKNEEFAGEFFADSKGYYTAVGLNVTMTPGPSTGIAELTGGTADVALSDAVSVGTAVAAEGAPVKIIGATYQKNPFTILSIVK